VIVGLSVPLGNPAAPDGARLRAEAVATRLDAERRALELAGEIDLMAARFEAAARHLARLEARLLATLEGRVGVVVEALSAGRATIDTLVRAQRDLLEAHHLHAELSAELAGQAVEAAALLRLLGDGRVDP